MKKFALLAIVVGLISLFAANAEAQVGYVTYYQPVTAYRPAPLPVYAPAPVVYSSYYAGPSVVAAPVPVYQPVARVRTRYRPILGGTVTRVRPAYYAPVVYGY